MAESQQHHILAALISARRDLSEAERRLQDLRNEARRAATQLAALQRQGVSTDDTRLVTAVERLAQADRDVQQQRDAMQQLKPSIRGLTEQLLQEGDATQDQLQSANSDLPYLLFPVRIETRFVARDLHALWVRVYPDDVMVESHEPNLTDEEYDAGEAFWRELWERRSEPEADHDPWERLSNLYDAPRAAWIVRQMTPANLADTQAQEPVFPAALRKPDSWSQPPVSRVMPDRWVVLGYTDGNLVSQEKGRPIPDPLVVGPNPDDVTAGASTQNGQLLDEEAEWLVDFQAAENMGMAVRLLFDSHDAFQRGFDRLVVLGVKTSADASTGAALLSELIEAHQYTNTFALVPQGTPTNNTPAGRSGFSSIEADIAGSLTLVRGAPQYQVTQEPGQQADGQRLAEAFGLAAEAFQRLPRAGGHEEQNARAMMTALWPATWGYYLEQKFRELLDEGMIEAARDHAIAWVRGRSPLAAVRCGGTPYGILPTSALSRWEADANEVWDAQLLSLLQRIVSAWTEAVERIPHVDEAQEERTLSAILGMHASSRDYGIRQSVSQAYVSHLLELQQNRSRLSILDRFRQNVRDLLERFDYRDLDPSANQTVHDTVRHPWRDALVQDGPLSETDPLDPNYIADALGALPQIATAGGVRHALPEAGVRGQSLLALVLYHAIQRAYVDTAYAMKRSRGLISREEKRDPEFVGMQQQDASRTPWEHLTDRIAGIPGTLEEYLVAQLHPTDASEVSDDPDLQPLQDMHTALASLQHLPTAELERLLTETLDTTSHRLDAWWTSLVTKRLWTLRATASASGIRLGGYGWVENLRPSRPPQPAPAEALIDPPGPVMVDPDNDGFIHTPSINHANAAAVLRNGYRHAGSAHRPSAMAVNLSSRRVRRALWLLDGVRQGQPLAALLGYRFERGVHEGHPGLELDRYIAPLRQLYPLVAKKLTTSPEAADAVAAANVVDGLRLLHHWRSKTIPFGPPDLPASEAPNGSDDKRAYDAMAQELDQLVDDFDALGDIATAESVYQLVNGNPMRAGTMLGTLSGTVRATDPDVLHMPRTGVSVTHRVMVLLAEDATRNAAWRNTTAWNLTTPRALAEPIVNDWVGRMLGEPGRIQCRVTVQAPEASPEIQMVTLEQLGLAPLDLVYISGIEGAAGATELEQRLQYHVLKSESPGTTVTLQFARDSSWPVDALSFVEVSELACQLRDVITRSRPLDPGDFTMPEAAEDLVGAVALGELQARAAGARLALHGDDLGHGGIIAMLEDTLASETLDVDARRDVLMAASDFGVLDGIPHIAAGHDVTVQDTLMAQIQAVLQELRKRAEQADAAWHAFQQLPDDSAHHTEAIQRLTTVLQATFGEAFRVLPRFQPPQVDDLVQSVGNPDLLDATDVDAPLRWFQQAARISPSLSRYETAMMLTEALGGLPFDLRVGQLPHLDAQRWVGLPLLNDALPRQGRLSLVLHTPLGLDAQTPYAGLFLDYFDERIPLRSQMTGVACHYDQPGARPPQTLLLATPPSLSKPWTWDDLVAVVNETLDMAKIRAVDPEALHGLGHHLPATMLAVNAEQATVSTDLLAHIRQ